MTRLSSFVLQVAVAVLVTTAGLVLDYKSLAIFGGALLALSLVLWLSGASGTSGQSNPAPVAPMPRVPPADLDAKQRAIWDLRIAYDEAEEAIRYWSGKNRRASLHRLMAAYWPVASHFGLPQEFSMEAFTTRQFLKLMTTYVETFLPLLEHGQYKAAKDVASNFAIE